MYGNRHENDQDFPEYHAEIYRLKQNDPHFTQLLSEYDDTDKHNNGLEHQLQPVSDGYFSDLKRRRVLLKDRLFAILRQHSFTCLKPGRRVIAAPFSKPTTFRITTPAPPPARRRSSRSRPAPRAAPPAGRFASRKISRAHVARCRPRDAPPPARADGRKVSRSR